MLVAAKAGEEGAVYRCSEVLGQHTESGKRTGGRVHDRGDVLKARVARPSRPGHTPQGRTSPTAKA
jgi:hypothetical protein